MDCLKSNEWWLENNGENLFARNNESLPDEFRKKFPVVAKYLDKSDAPLSTVATLDDIWSEEEIRNIDAEQNYIYHTALAWHFANWDHILKFVKAEYNAVSFAWITDEDVDYFELI